MFCAVFTAICIIVEGLREPSTLACSTTRRPSINRIHARTRENRQFHMSSARFYVANSCQEAHPSDALSSSIAQSHHMSCTVAPSPQMHLHHTHCSPPWGVYHRGMAYYRHHQGNRATTSNSSRQSSTSDSGKCLPGDKSMTHLGFTESALKMGRWKP
jgi:hypothetical protein